MTVSVLRSIFVQVNKIFNYDFNILGYQVSFYKLILFEVVLFLILYAILTLFHKD